MNKFQQQIAMVLMSAKDSEKCDHFVSWLHLVHPSCAGGYTLATFFLFLNWLVKTIRLFNFPFDSVFIPS